MRSFWILTVEINRFCQTFRPPIALPKHWPKVPKVETTLFTNDETPKPFDFLDLVDDWWQTQSHYIPFDQYLIHFQGINQSGVNFDFFTFSPAVRWLNWNNSLMEYKMCYFLFCCLIFFLGFPLIACRQITSRSLKSDRCFAIRFI